MTDWLWAALLFTGFVTWTVLPVIVAVRLVQKRLDARHAQAKRPGSVDVNSVAPAIDLRIWQDLRDLPRPVSRIS
jgi:hypothetical protein